MTLPCTWTLRDGRLAELRRSRRGDEAGLWALQRALGADGRGMVLLPEELPAEPDPEALTWWLAHPDSLHAVAVVDGAVAGTIDVRRVERIMLRHTGMLTMGVHPDFQGIGLGRVLVEAALRWAQREGVDWIELYTRGDNVRAQALYRSVGFELAWTRTGFLRPPDGPPVDDLVMVWRGR